jgi:hypothetical protein
MKSKIFIPLAFLFTFLLGGLAGYLAAPDSGFTRGSSYEQERMERPERTARQDRNFGAVRARMIEDLQLTPAQQEPFFTVIGDHRRGIREAMDEQRRVLDRKMAQYSDSLHQSLTGILTAEQMALWEEKYSRRALMERRRHQRREGQRQGR